jgi:hypothetical protein
MPGKMSETPAVLTWRLVSRPAALNAASTGVSGRRYSSLVVGEEIDVLGGPVDDPVCNQCVATTQRESVLGGRAQRNGGNPTMELVERHQSGSRVLKQGRVTLFPGVPHSPGQVQVAPDRH